VIARCHLKKNGYLGDTIRQRNRTCLKHGENAIVDQVDEGDDEQDEGAGAVM